MIVRYTDWLLLFQVKKHVSYAESDSEGEDDDEEIFRPGRKTNVRGRVSKRQKMSPESDEDFEQDAGGYSDDGRYSFVTLTRWAPNFLPEC